MIRRQIERVKYAYRDIRDGIRNLCWFLPAVWRFREWDYVGILGLIRVAATRMAERHRDADITMDSPQIAAELFEVAKLCDRLTADDYFVEAGYDPETWMQLTNIDRSRISWKGTELARYDTLRLGTLFCKVQWWWD